MWLYAGDMKSAHGYFQDAMEVPEFQHSEEALAADALFYAYKTGDASAVKKARPQPGSALAAELLHHALPVCIVPTILSSAMA